MIDIEDRIAVTRRPINQPVVMLQRWDHLLFLHWVVPVDSLQMLLPPELTVDTFEGNAYIGLVPFTMRDVRPVGFPAVQGLSHFHEVNVRTYVYAEGSASALPGVWFFSLDAANPIAVQIARALFHLPYYFARMTLAQNEDGSIRYSSDRAIPRSTLRIGTALRYTPTDEPHTATPGTLEYFLCERYLLYSRRNGRLFTGRVHHTPYPIQGATLHHLEDSLVTAAGLTGVTDTSPPLIQYASGVSVEVFPLIGLPSLR